MAESNPSRILLRKVNFHSSGIYRCEITSSNFEIYEKYEQMTVIGKGTFGPFYLHELQHRNRI
jgi:hypothetical protein